MEIKDSEQKNTISNGQAYIEQGLNSFYSKQSNVSFIAKKTEKITTAIYMVTDFIPDSEPLKIQLRTLAVELMSATKKMQAKGSDSQPVFYDEVVRTIEETVSFISLASTIGIVSEMNGLILNTELVKVKNSIKDQFGNNQSLVTYHPGYANVLLNQSMFEIPSTEFAEDSLYKGHEINKGHINHDSVLYKNSQKMPVPQVSVSKKTDLGNKIARRNDVLSIVRNKGKVSIKDISQILKDIGDKTLQRELHGLVQEGVLIKEGEKRWSMYRIAQ